MSIFGLIFGFGVWIIHLYISVLRSEYKSRFIAFDDVLTSHFVNDQQDLRVHRR